jgi:hypothetical protein
VGRGGRGRGGGWTEEGGAGGLVACEKGCDGTLVEVGEAGWVVGLWRICCGCC